MFVAVGDFVWVATAVIYIGMIAQGSSLPITLC